MQNRRKFLKNTLITAAGISMLPDKAIIASTVPHPKAPAAAKLKLRFALISDGHYGQKDTDYKKFFSNAVSWLNADHGRQPIDFCIINGDIVHDRPDLLPETKQYFDRLKMPYYTVPGNHDFATTAIWKEVWGYDDNHSFASGDYGFVLGNTSNEKGEYLCPNVNFLKVTLDRFRTKKKVFVILHIPSHQWESVGIQCPDVDELFAQYNNIAAIFHGHHHEQDAVKYSNDKKLAHFFDAHIGGSWGTAYKGYRIVEIDQQDQIATYQYNASQSPVLNENKLG